MRERIAASAAIHQSERQPRSASYDVHMSLARAWLRELSGASGVALVVPAAIVVALALLGIAGGFAGFGALGQALAGPGVPRQVAAVANSQEPSRAVPSVLGGHRASFVARGGGSHAVAASAKVNSAKAGLGGASGGRGAATGSSGHSVAPGSASVGTGSGPGASAPGGSTGAGGSSPSVPSTPTTPSTPSSPSPISGLTKTVTHVTKPVTSPLPSSVTKPVKKVLKTVTGQLPPLPGLP